MITNFWIFWILIIGGKELVELRHEKEESDKFYRDELCRIGNIIEEKGKRVPLSKYLSNLQLSAFYN